MIKRGYPRKWEDYIVIEDEDIMYRLARLGYHAEFMDDKCLYYRKTEELERLLEA